MQQHLGGLSINDYRSLLCIDDETIEKGGEEIVNSKGDIGSLLFSAAAGISDLSATLDAARLEADGIFKPRASATQLARYKAAHAQIDKQIKSVDVSASAYRKLKTDYDAALSNEARIEAERSDLVQQKILNQTLLDAIPQLARLTELEQLINPFSDYPEHIDINAEELVDLLKEHDGTHRDVARLSKEFSHTQERLAEISYVEEHVVIAGELQALEDLRIRYRAAQVDLGEQERNYEQSLQDMAEISRDIDESDEPDPLPLVASATILNALETALQKINEADSAVKRETEQVQTLSDASIAAQKACEHTIEQQPEGDGLAQLFIHFNVDELSRQQSAAEQSILDAERACQSALEALTIRGLVFESVTQNDIHSDEVQEQVERWQELSHLLQKLQSDGDSLKSEILSLQTRITQLDAREGVISDEQAKELLAQREQLWLLHKGEFSDHSAQAFEDAMYQLDNVSQLRIAGATEIGMLRQLESGLADAQAKSDVYSSRQSELEREKQSIETKELL